MSRNKFLRWGSALAIALAFAACENGIPTQPQAGPEMGAPSFDVITKKLKKGAKAVEETNPEVGYVQAVFDSKGGTLQIGSHQISIPKKAVREPTLFTLIKPEAGKLAFSLRAERDGVDVGAAGFDKPVTLTISYKTAKDVDPSALAIGWVREDGEVEFLPTKVNRGQVDASADLEHFSDYILAIP